ncbi:MAG TPA: NAD+ synthase [Bacillota bacterium]|nr:NAD+ synthase [Bacillota bacterium]
MRITLAQLNPVVGDIKGNLERILQTLATFGGKTDLLVFPELFLVGYPPKDLLERTWFIDQVEEAIGRISEVSREYPETGVLFGAPLRTGKAVGKGLTNSAVFVYQGEIILNQAKSLLPTYDVFDEARHFDAATAVTTVNFKGECLGVSVCEDAWNGPDYQPVSSMYSIDPIAELVKAGATLLINLSASPFHLGKEELRHRIIRDHARRHGVPFCFVNQVGGNDELIFDGGSMAFDRNGDPLTPGHFFEENIETVDFSSRGTAGLYQPLERTEALYRALVLGIKDYLRKCGFSQVVIGLSGGIDSALTACLAVAALGKENVLGISMPSPYSSEGSVTDSEKLARKLGIKFLVIPISSVFQSYLGMLDGYFAGKAPDQTEENIQARIRGNIIMAFSNKFGYLALSTGNKSEMAVGYCTLYGDMSGGLSVISDVPKTMVYELSRYINRQEEIIPEAIIDKAPSAELRPDQKDQDTLPPYPVLDEILYYYIEEGYSAEQIIERGFEPATVKWVITTVDRNEYKRRQAAPGLKVTSKAFGAGRRIPIAKRISAF